MSYLKQISDKELKEGIEHFIQEAKGKYVPSVTLDTVIFGFHDNKLKVLLLRFAQTAHFILPGGYLSKDEDLDMAALRVLRERTGLDNIFLEQFYTSGKKNRTSNSIVSQLMKDLLGNLPADHWFNQRFVSVCYYALVDDTKVNPKPEPFFTEFKWFDIEAIPVLLYDHNLIVEKALKRLQTDLDTKLVGSKLMRDSFTMNELQKLYEAVFQHPFVRTNFQRKMLSLGILERLEKQYTGKSHKAPYLYRFTKDPLED
ncbi:NUDIX hydrolase [Olivibacter domesticus]|uniref:ADP-ribose pyrophosphatase YjhB, NUDIX family n=1 Tax=Olivibacter domesticus TaxID=407022 RepID=A0A1H7H674_OLID1|nr:NUDIX domain-containing protein [Olivibacter domesticus]SEK45267.1 ADP-ribose pyrophosphatase YjhB, NUDIX family [Olivibacter domesticus]